MGGGSWNSTQWQGYAAQNIQGKSQSQVFSAQQLHEDIDPRKFKNGIRESVDSVDNPNSTPVCIFTDATGSMGALAHAVVTKFDVVGEELRDRKPVPDVHVMTGVIGDAYTDRAPFQATQFEADIRIVEQTQKLWLGGCMGGGNGGESYALAWLFAAMQTATDSFDKRGKKGYLFTVGDEPVHGVPGSTGEKAGVTVSQAKQFLGLDIERDLSAEECLQMALRRWNCYHIVIESASHYLAGIHSSFGKIMPDRLIFLEGQNIEMLPEIIVSTIQVNEGKDKASVAASWSGNTSVVVAKAMQALATRDAAGQEVVRL
jgi:hypothetical protein